MEALNALRDAGVDVQTRREPRLDEGDRPDAVIDVSVGDVTERFVIETKARAPYPNEVSHLVAQVRAFATAGRPMLIAPYVSEPLGDYLIQSGVSWADARGNFDLRTSALVLRQRLSNSPPKPKRSALPQGSGSLAIVRCLINFTDDEAEEHTGTALAAQARVSQPRSSQVLHQLLDLDLVVRTEAGRWVPRREALLDRFLSDYRGPGGSEQFLYSLDPPIDVAARAAEVADVRIAVSADVGPDLISAWRRPTEVIIYTEAELNSSMIGAVDAAGRDDANVIVRIPADRSVFPNPQLVADYQGIEIPLADPIQQIWDLEQLGGADRLEAAGNLRSWLLTSR